jgi:predicted metalloprotease with PDZ domain
MRALWERYGATGKGVPEDGIERLLKELAGNDTRDFFARYVYGTEDPPLEALLDAFSVDWHLRPASNAKDRGGRPASDPPPASWLGAKLRDDLSLQHVFTDGPAERAGLAANDMVVAIDGVRASTASLDALRTDHAPGRRISVHAFRRDELITVELELAEPPLDTCWLSLRDDAGTEAIALRAAWLKG